MAFIEWQESYETGFGPYDTQHRTLFRLVNRLKELVDRPLPAGHAPNGKAPDLMEVYLAFVELTRAHVETEGELMAFQGYPTTQDHDSAHDRFLALLESAEAADDIRPVILDALQKFKSHFEGVDEQGFLFLLRQQNHPSAG